MNKTSEKQQVDSRSKPRPATRKLSLAAARRVALAAQGFGQARLGKPVGPREIRNVIGRLALLQLDTANVFCRSRYMPVYSRLARDQIKQPDSAI